MRKYVLSAILILCFLINLDKACGNKMNNEPVVKQLIVYLDTHIDEFHRVDIDPSEDNKKVVTSYGNGMFKISQVILPGQLIHSVAYYINDTEVDNDVAQPIFYHIENALKQYEKQKLYKIRTSAVLDSEETIEFIKRFLEDIKK